MSSLPLSLPDINPFIPSGPFTHHQAATLPSLVLSAVTLHPDDCMMMSIALNLKSRLTPTLLVDSGPSLMPSPLDPLYFSLCSGIGLLAGHCMDIDIAVGCIFVSCFDHGDLLDSCKKLCNHVCVKILYPLISPDCFELFVWSWLVSH